MSCNRRSGFLSMLTFQDVQKRPLDQYKTFVGVFYRCVMMVDMLFLILGGLNRSYRMISWHLSFWRDVDYGRRPRGGAGNGL